MQRIAFFLTCLAVGTFSGYFVSWLWSPHKITADELIRHYHMTKIPHEGPWFVQNYKSQVPVDGTIAAQYPSLRYTYTVELGLGTDREFSAMHKLATDEIWNFQGGDPLSMLLLYPDGSGNVITLGSDVLAGQLLQFVVPKGVWQGTRSISRDYGYSLVGCTLAPGFEYADYTPGYRDQLQKGWPQFREQIADRTREGSLVAPPSVPPVDPDPAASESSIIKGMLTELVGLKAPIFDKNLSVAHFIEPAGSPGQKRLNSASDEVILVYSGTAFLHMNGGTETAKPGEVLNIPANTAYQLECAPSAELDAYAFCTPAFDPAQHHLLSH